MASRPSKGRDAHSESFHQIVKTGKIALYLAAGFARVATKELSSYPSG